MIAIRYSVNRALWLDHNRLFGNNPKLPLFHLFPPSSNVVEMMYMHMKLLTSFSTTLSWRGNGEEGAVLKSFS